MLTFSPQMQTNMLIASGISWTLVYLLIIKRGFQDKTYGMPLWALAANLSWEFVFAALILSHNPTQHTIDAIWCLFDVVITYQFLRFGRESFRGTILERYFLPMALVVLLTCFGAVYTLTLGIESFIQPVQINGRYAAFAQNLMMSILFVSMLINRNNVRGQSIYIALFKLIGTLIPSLLFYSLAPSEVFLTFLYVAIFGFDLLYLVLVYVKCRELKINPWTRF